MPLTRYMKWELPKELTYFGHFDIGIMPLQDSSFARGKCAFKLIQYMAAAIPVVASPVGANCVVVEPCRTGYFASTDEDWRSMLQLLIDDPQLRRRLGENGRDLVHRCYSVAGAWPTYARILTGVRREEPALRPLILFFGIVIQTLAWGTASRGLQLGIDADNWSGQTQNRQFENSLRRMKLDFVSWHIAPEEEKNPERLRAIVDFCRKNGWSYLFNTEIVNYRRGETVFKHADGTYRYDLAEHTLSELKDDPLFLGVVYDEADLMQALCGVLDEKGREIAPYLADTRKMSAPQAFLAVSAKVGELEARYRHYGKRLIFEMTFPDYPFAFARGGALLAPKLLKENYNDLMYSVYRGAALEYESKELWGCVDLWFLDKFPYAGKYGAGFHTPLDLEKTLQFAYSAGFDFAYIEQSKALMTEAYTLSVYGDKVIEFQNWRLMHEHGDWRTAPVASYIKRFPDGYWGQDYSSFIPDHPYGSWAGNPYREVDARWFQALHELSKGSIPAGADTWKRHAPSVFCQSPIPAFRWIASIYCHRSIRLHSAPHKARNFRQVTRSLQINHRFAIGGGPAGANNLEHENSAVSDRYVFVRRRRGSCSRPCNWTQAKGTPMYRSAGAPRRIAVRTIAQKRYTRNSCSCA